MTHETPSFLRRWSARAGKSLSPRGAAILAVVAACAGAALSEVPGALRALFAEKTAAPATATATAADGLIRLTPEQIAAAAIETGKARSGVLTRRISAPALVSADSDRIGRVAAKVAGTVAELRKNIGDPVEKGEILAFVESREVADAKSEYLASVVNFDLQNHVFQRDRGLYDKKVIAEHAYLRSQVTYSEAKLRMELARQKLATLDLSEAEISALAQQPIGQLRRKEIRSPIAGRVTERRANLGQPVGGEGQEKELFVIADLSVVWADLAVSLADLPSVHEKQAATLLAQDGRRLEGAVIFVSPLVTQGTQSARVVARFPNPDLAVRPGGLFTARIALDGIPAKVIVPKSAIQIVNREPSVFVRTEEGFLRRRVETGASDDESIEILSGVAAGEEIAVANTFALKAELGKLQSDLSD